MCILFYTFQSFCLVNSILDIQIELCMKAYFVRLSLPTEMSLVLATAFLRKQLINQVIKFGKERTNINFPIYTVLIRLALAELAIASYSQQQLGVASGQLVISWTPNLIVLAEQTNSPIYIVLIQLEIVELAIASCSQWIANQSETPWIILYL